MQTANSMDADELLHLAIHASEHDKPQEAIQLLKNAIEISPENGQAYYLLGALHAEIGMYERAIEEIQHATELAPDLHAAHFQLGLLHLTSAHAEEASAAWEPLKALPEDHPLALFRKGLLALADNQFQACIDALEAGIQNNPTLPPLNNDMRKVIQASQQALDANQNDAATPPASVNKTNPTGQHLFMSAYRPDDNSSDD